MYPLAHNLHNGKEWSDQRRIISSHKSCKVSVRSTAVPTLTVVNAKNGYTTTTYTRGEVISSTFSTLHADVQYVYTTRTNLFDQLPRQHRRKFPKQNPLRPFHKKGRGQAERSRIGKKNFLMLAKRKTSCTRIFPHYLLHGTLVPIYLYIYDAIWITWNSRKPPPSERDVFACGVALKIHVFGAESRIYIFLKVTTI